MIDKVSQIKTVKAIDLPPTFDIRVGANTFPFEVESVDETYVYMLDTTSKEIVYIPREYEITILVPDTWDNAKWDISLDLMQRGMI